jgi:hypothetical protein
MGGSGWLAMKKGGKIGWNGLGMEMVWVDWVGGRRVNHHFLGPMLREAFGHILWMRNERPQQRTVLVFKVRLGLSNKKK